MSQPRGYVVVSGPDGTREADTVTCRHCNRVHALVAGVSVGFCRQCMAAVCEPCEARCTPLERRLEAAEARDRLRRSLS
jgi:hypothetical protein